MLYQRYMKHSITILFMNGWRVKKKCPPVHKLQYATQLHTQEIRVAPPPNGNRNVVPIVTFARPIHSVPRASQFRLDFLPAQSSIELNLSSTSSTQILVKCAHSNVQIQRALFKVSVHPHQTNSSSLHLNKVSKFCFSSFQLS